MVLDLDLESYFDTIPHDQLMACVERRIADRSLLRLIRMWLRSPVVEASGPRRPQKGTPQGGVISPLLANIYLHEFDRRFNGPEGPAEFAGARLVRYADDAEVCEGCARLHAMTQRRIQLPISELIRRINEYLRGWSNYFRFGYPRVAFWKVNWYVQVRLRRYVRTRSQRRCRHLDGRSLYKALRAQGLVYL